MNATQVALFAPSQYPNIIIIILIKPFPVLWTTYVKQHMYITFHGLYTNITIYIQRDAQGRGRGTRDSALQAAVLQAGLLNDGDAVVAGRHGKAHGEAGQRGNARGQVHAGRVLQRQLALVVGAAAPQLLAGAHKEAVARPRADLDATSDASPASANEDMMYGAFKIHSTCSLWIEQ